MRRGIGIAVVVVVIIVIVLAAFTPDPGCNADSCDAHSDSERHPVSQDGPITSGAEASAGSDPPAASILGVRKGHRDHTDLGLNSGA